MKSKKLLEKLNTLLGIGADADKEHIRMLRKVLLTLKEKQATLQARLEEPQSEHERRKIKQKIEVIQRQREKGVPSVLVGTFDANNRKDLKPEYHSYRGGRPRQFPDGQA